MTRKSKIECFCERTHSMQQCLSSAVFPLKGNQPSTYVPHTHSPSFRTFSLRHRNKDCVGRDWNLPDKRRPFPHDLVLLCMPRISRSSGLSFFRSRLSSFIIFPGTKFSSNWALLGSLIFRKLQQGWSSWPIFFFNYYPSQARTFNEMKCLSKKKILTSFFCGGFNSIHPAKNFSRQRKLEIFLDSRSRISFKFVYPLSLSLSLFLALSLTH